jgi:hypothetical protein
MGIIATAGEAPVVFSASSSWCSLSFGWSGECIPTIDWSARLASRATIYNELPAIRRCDPWIVTFTSRRRLSASTSLPLAGMNGVDAENDSDADPRSSVCVAIVRFYYVAENVLCARYLAFHGVP